MYNTDTELLFPIRVISKLQNSRGEVWNDFLNELTSPNSNFFCQLAFVYTMVRLGGCVSCNTGSFRAMRGCTQCALQTVKRFRGTDEELIEQFNQAKSDVLRLAKRQNINRDQFE